MANQHIVIVSQTHICRNPRVLKEALALSNSGFKVTILTFLYSKILLKEDLMLLDDKIHYDYYSNQMVKNLSSFIDRFINKIAKLLQLNFKLESKHSLGYGFNRLVKKCKSAKADLYIMHQELALIAGNELIKQGFHVAADFEDYYSEDLLPEARKHRPLNLLKNNERYALAHAAYVTTTSKVMASHLHQEYGGKKPSVIRNVFPLNERNDFFDQHSQTLKLYWLSQTIGPGRGLSLLIAAVNLINYPLEIHLRGKVAGNYDQHLSQQLQKQHQLFFHPMLANKEIISDMINYDVGLALEPKKPLNKLLTSSNKIFNYLVGGLPVIASNTLGQIEVANLQKEESIMLFDGTAKGLADTINRLLSIKNTLKTLKKNAYVLAKEQLNWDIEEKKLLQIIKQNL